jgi:conjugal transfer pilus assembly protein TraV
MKIILKHSTICSLLALLAVSTTGCGFLNPYKSEFACGDGTHSFNGNCESVEDAYNDSVKGIDARQLDPKWKEKRAQWEKKNKDLVDLRKQIDDAAPNVHEAIGYREALFNEMKGVLQAPETPLLVPPTPVRILVLDSVGGEEGALYTSPHYVWVILDKPKWSLKKIPELMSSGLGRDRRADQINEYLNPKVKQQQAPKQLTDGAAQSDIIDAYVGGKK